MELVPTQPVPSQTFAVILGGQQARVSLRQMSTGLYVDLSSNDREVVGLVVCENANRVVRNSYLGFLGDLVFWDTEGKGADPVYTGLGSRFQLYYLTAAEVAALGG